LSCFVTATSTPRHYTLSLHDALPISARSVCSSAARPATTCCSPSATRPLRIRTRSPAPPPPSSPTASRTSTTSTARPSPSTPPRSEEHTSELQSRENLVCRLLLEKKK